MTNIIPQNDLVTPSDAADSQMLISFCMASDTNLLNESTVEQGVKVDFGPKMMM